MTPLVSPQLEVADDFEAVQELLLVPGWSDGLPIVPPNPERVRAMLAGCGFDAQQVIAERPPNWGEATVERLAINAVLAVCRAAEDLPVIIAAVTAMSDPAFNLYAVQATPHPCAPLLIVNGPIVERLGLNGRFRGLRTRVGGPMPLSAGRCGWLG